MQSFNPDTVSAIAFFCVAGLAGLSMVFTLVFGLYGTVGGTIYVAAKAANNARLEVRLPSIALGVGCGITQTPLRHAHLLTGLATTRVPFGCRVGRAVDANTLMPGNAVVEVLVAGEGSLAANHMEVRTPAEDDSTGSEGVCATERAEIAGLPDRLVYALSSWVVGQMENGK